MRLVLDTNAVVSALVFGGLPLKLLQMGIEQNITLYTSPVLLGELREVLQREHLAPRLARQHGDLEQAMVLYERACLCVRPTSVPRVVPDDPDDDHVVAAAIAANAQLIVSGDKGLLRLHGRIAIPVLNVHEALARIAASR